MNKKNVVLTSLIALGVAGGLYFGVSKSEASATPEQEAKQAMTVYLDAVESGNAEEAAKYVKDVRFKDYTDTVANYKEMSKSDPVTNYKIHAVKASDATHAVADLEFTTQEQGNQRYEVKLQKYDEGWKVIFDEIKHIKAKK